MELCVGNHTEKVRYALKLMQKRGAKIAINFQDIQRETGVESGKEYTVLSEYGQS